MEWWPCGMVAMWHGGHVAWWPCGMVAMWHSGHVAWWPCGHVAWWPCGMVAMWHGGHVPCVSWHGDHVFPWLIVNILITTIQVNWCRLVLALNSPESSLLKFLPLTYHHSHFLASTLDFTSFFTIVFYFYSLAVLN